ncbi:MAG TPA: cytochrome c3 family protein [Phycisphaerae bacterium]|jgi:predicted CXXCH cytochrome family protein
MDGLNSKRRGRLRTLTAALTVMAAVLVLARRGAGDIRGSKHDFTRAEWNVTNAACLPCHVAHEYARPEPKVGLWERAAAPRVAELYAPVRSTPGPSSLRCLACHDANSAPDTFGDETGALGPQLPARARIAVNGRLSTDHPIGVRYPLGDSQFQPVGAATANQRVRLFDRRVECSSCHEVHNAFELPYMLVMPNTQSQMCLNCHRL